MNKELFRSMQEQLRPSGDARDALTEKLASAKKKTVPVGRYVAIAACIAVIVAAVPVYRAVRDHLKWQILLDNFHPASTMKATKPHSYELADGAACWPGGDAVTTENTTVTSNEDQGAGIPPDGEAVNTGEAELPSDALDQGEAVMAYQKLMARFEADYGPDRYPDWYGGAYIDEHAGLIVNIVECCEPEDKELFFQIWDWAGSDRVGFGSSQMSLNQLRELQDKVLQAMDELGLAAGCGIDEKTGRVVLTLPEVTDEALWRLARLDPEDTAIQVIAAQTVTTDTAEEPAPVTPDVSHVIQPGGDVEEDDAIAYEPQG